MFGQFAREYLLWHQSEHPASFYRIEQLVRQHLVPAFAFTPLDMITPQLAEQFKFDRQKTAAAATVGKEIRTLKAILNKAIEWGRIRSNPIHFVSEPKQLNSGPERFYSAEELQLIYRASPDRPHVWRLMANTGIRRGEALQLRWADVGHEEIRVLSTEDERTKSGKWRIVPLSEGAREALEAFKRDGDRVLPRIRPESLSRAFLHDAARASLDGSLHTLRHTFISHLVMKGVPLRTVQILAGHAHFTTTERYAHLAPGYLQNTVAGLRL
jgi:integrase